MTLEKWPRIARYRNKIDTAGRVQCTAIANAVKGVVPA